MNRSVLNNDNRYTIQVSDYRCLNENKEAVDCINSPLERISPKMDKKGMAVLYCFGKYFIVIDL